MLLIDAMALAFFFSGAVAGYSANIVIPALALKWETTGALLEFFRWMPMLQFLAIAVALGTVEGRGDELVASAILPAAVLSAMLAAAAITAVPGLEGAKAAALRSSGLFNAALADTRQALDAGELAKAEASAARARAISPSDRRLVELGGVLSAALARAPAEKPPPAAPPAPPNAIASGAKAYYLAALKLFDKGRYFEANWYAQTAARIDPTYIDAKRLAATTWERLAAKSVDRSDEARAAFYGRKLDGYGRLVSGDSIGAYRIFSELAIAHGSDPDVRRYLAESLAAVKKSAFFTGEADAAFAGTVLGPVFLRIPTKDGGLRFLTAREAAWGDNALFFRQVEVLRTAAPSRGGAETFHVYSAYGKLSQDTLFLTCVDERHPSIAYMPRWMAGPSDGIASALDMPLAPDEAYRLIASQVAPRSLSLPAAWRAASEDAVYGIDPRPLIAALLARSAIPFAVFTAAALGIFAGVRFRRRKNRSAHEPARSFTRGHYLLVPFMAAALIPVLVLTERIDLLISTWSARVVPGLGALGLASGLHALVLFLAVLLLAGAGTEPKAKV
ncbi:MAG TPA: hypothetical protein VMV90_03405 [Rectinemataceae bacterium]|nr:hypothetical protein [Rectinemataceae bacterium]